MTQRHGELSLYHTALIQTACRHEARALLWQRWLREKFDSLSVEQLLSITREMGVASDSRDRCLRGLGLDPIVERDKWAKIYDEEPAANGNATQACPPPASRDVPPPDAQSPTPAPDAATHALGALNAMPPPGKLGNIPTTKGECDRLVAGHTAALDEPDQSRPGSSGGLSTENRDKSE